MSVNFIGREIDDPMSGRSCAAARIRERHSEVPVIEKRSLFAEEITTV
jgi:hypothetical protein